MAGATGTLRFPSPGPRLEPPPAVPAVIPPVGGPQRRSGVPGIVVGAGAVLALVFGAVGVWWLVAVVVAVAFAVTYVWWEDIVEGVAAPLRRFSERLVDDLFAFVRVARVSTASWTRKGRAEVRVRSRQLQVRRRHEQALHALGHAVYKGDKAGEDTARARAAETEEELRRYARELELARAEADASVERERAATDSTREFR